VIVVGVAAYQTWTPVLDPAAPLFAPVVGGAIGLLSGLYPASRAARWSQRKRFDTNRVRDALRNIRKPIAMLNMAHLAAPHVRGYS